MRDGNVRSAAAAAGLVALVAAGAVGFVTVPKGYESVCGAVFERQDASDHCDDVQLRLTVAVVVLGVVGLALVVFGLAGRIGGARLVVATVLVAGVWVLGVAGVNRLLRYDVCGSVTTPAEWPGNPSPDGRIRPVGCDGVLPGRRALAVGLWAGAAALGAALVVVVVRRAPERSAGAPRAHPVGDPATR